MRQIRKPGIWRRHRAPTPVEVAWLDGVDTPYINKQEGFTTDGIATKIRIDAGVAPLDWRGLVRSSVA